MARRAGRRRWAACRCARPDRLQAFSARPEGLRTRDGAEFGIGPNISPAGVALAMAAGVTFRAGVLNISMNFAVVPSKEGMRVSLLTGFTLRR